MFEYLGSTGAQVEAELTLQPVGTHQSDINGKDMRKRTSLLEMILCYHKSRQFDDRNSLLDTLADFSLHHSRFTQNQPFKRNPVSYSANAYCIFPGSVHLKAHSIVEDALRCEDDLRCPNEKVPSQQKSRQENEHEK